MKAKRYDPPFVMPQMKRVMFYYDTYKGRSLNPVEGFAVNHPHVKFVVSNRISGKWVATHWETGCSLGSLPHNTRKDCVLWACLKLDAYIADGEWQRVIAKHGYEVLP